MLTYTYRYNRVIQWFKDHPIEKEKGKTETHHIVPVSCGGLDEESNLVVLPTRWHYIVHCWLPAVYIEQGKQREYEKMLFAWKRMDNSRKDFRKSLQSIKEDSKLYQELREAFSNIIGKQTSIIQHGERNSNYGHHWWKDPNDKTKSLSIKEGDPVPEGWIPGKWQIQSENTKCIINDDTGKKRYIKKDLPIPKGWHIFEKQYKFKVIVKTRKKQLKKIKKNLKKNKNNISKSCKKIFINKAKHCKWCGAIKTKKENHCKHPEICARMRLIPKMIEYFGFDKTAIGTERYYEEFFRIRDMLYEIYFIQKLPLSYIAEKFNYTPGACPLANFMKSLFGKDALRNYSESNLEYRNRINQ